MTKRLPLHVEESKADQIRAVFAHYRIYHPRANPKPSEKQKEWAKIRARLEEGYTVADLCLAIDGCHRSPWNMGENPGGKKYTSLELIVRDSSHVQQYMEAAEQPSGPVLSERTQRGVRAAQSFLKRHLQQGEAS